MARSFRAVVIIASTAVAGCFALAAGCSNVDEPGVRAPGVADREGSGPSLDHATAPPVRRETDASRRIRRLESSVRSYRKLADETEDWGHLGSAVDAQLAKARLTGRFEDYARAGEMVDRAFERASGTAGPLMAAMRYHMALHHFDRARRYARRVADNPLIGSTRDLAAVRRVQGALALQRGELERAERLFRESYRLVETPGAAARIALFEFRTGDRKSAEKWLDRAANAGSELSDLQLAWVRLQRGVLDLDSGRYEPAREHFERADETFSGWYMIEEHLAEVHGLLGDESEAIALYESILERLPRGVFRAALAAVYEQAGRSERAERLVRRARESIRSNLEEFPSATYGHALGVFLQYGPADRALELARENHDLRPGPKASLALAQAHLENGNLERARTEIEAVLSTRWDTAAMHATAWKVYEATGRSRLAQRELRRARRRHPKVESAFDWLDVAD